MLKIPDKYKVTHQEMIQIKYNFGHFWIFSVLKLFFASKIVDDDIFILAFASTKLRAPDSHDFYKVSLHFSIKNPKFAGKWSIFFKKSRKKSQVQNVSQTFEEIRFRRKWLSSSLGRMWNSSNIRRTWTWYFWNKSRYFWNVGCLSSLPNRQIPR